MTTNIKCLGRLPDHAASRGSPAYCSARAAWTVVFGWITCPSREARNAGMKKAMDDECLKNFDMTLDGKRMTFSGFRRTIRKMDVKL